MDGDNALGCGCVVIVVVLLLTGCLGALVTGARENAGPARERLADEVEAIDYNQERLMAILVQAAEELTKSSEIRTADDLKSYYDRIHSLNERSIALVEVIDGRIRTIHDLSDRLILEWEDELEDYNSESLRASSRAKMQETNARQNEYVALLYLTRSMIDPILDDLSDQTLYLKHNLDSASIHPTQQSAQVMIGNIDPLIGQLGRSMDATEKFLLLIDATDN